MASIALQNSTVARTKQSSSKSAEFQKIITVHMQDLHRYALWLTKDKAVSEDLVQETMLRAWKSFENLKKPEVAKSWLITILRRENARRFERYQPSFSAIPTEEIGDPHRYNDTSTEAFAVRRALSELAKEYREPLLLQIVYGYSQKEISKHLGISVAGAGTRLFRARRKLRAMLEE
jgi:RNA polymerase sigma-70 factor (ECF subfamily)